LSDGLARPSMSARFRVNHSQRRLEQNARWIGAYLEAHTTEFSDLVERGCATFLAANPDLRERLSRTRQALEHELAAHGPVYLDGMPPEIRSPTIRHPTDPGMVMQLLYPPLAPSDDEA